jgi:Na+-transporting NADH:ubiquinone oxidoreductase subunit NqrD
MKRRKILIISAFLALLIAVIAEVMMYLTAMLDGKYTLTEATYNSHINGLAIALVISNIYILGLLIWIVKLLKR